ncbi:MAG: hypothetical protein P1P74_10790 [Desulfuromonadales bacterium]|nr:hypothetical protein [Desulfuromonadales bacterium]
MTIPEKNFVPADLICLLSAIGLTPVLNRVVPPGTKLWLAGGALRDAFLGNPPGDFDFSSSVPPAAIAHAFAAAVSGRCFMLDEERLQYRVLWWHEGERFTADFAPLRGADIHADLRDRDFTLNAMAWEVTAEDHELLDPLGGLEALRAAALRMCTRGAFENDPVRVLRGIRLATTHQLTIDNATFKQMCISGKYLKYSPGERLRDELVKLLAVRCGEYLDQLRRAGIDGLIFGTADDQDKWDERVAIVKRYEAQVDQRSADICPTLSSLGRARVHDDIKRLTFLKLCCFYRAGTPLKSGWFSERLRLSRRNCELLERLTRLNPDHVDACRQVADNCRARALWAASLDSDPASALLLLSLLNPSRDVLDMLEKVATDWLSLDRDGHIDSLMNGDDMRRLFPYIDGPQTGNALNLLREAEIFGSVYDADSAAEFLVLNREKVFDFN